MRIRFDAAPIFFLALATACGGGETGDTGPQPKNVPAEFATFVGTHDLVAYGAVPDTVTPRFTKDGTYQLVIESGRVKIPTDPSGAVIELLWDDVEDHAFTDSTSGGASLSLWADATTPQLAMEWSTGDSRVEYLDLWDTNGSLVGFGPSFAGPLPIPAIFGTLAGTHTLKVTSTANGTYAVDGAVVITVGADGTVTSDNGHGFTWDRIGDRAYSGSPGSMQLVGQLGPSLYRLTLNWDGAAVTYVSMYPVKMSTSDWYVAMVPPPP